MAAAALIIASSEYEDGELRQLRAPTQDAERLAAVLADAAIGGFTVRSMVNEPSHVLNLAVEDFFADRARDDLLLLYVSCHGVKDDDGRLYFAAGNTRLPRLGATAVAATFVSEQMARSRSRRIVLVLDCCYSGAFPKGFLARAPRRVDIKERFDGRGRAVLTASSALEYSFEGDRMTGKGIRSVFTHALVEGLETGLADLDHDGLVSVDELYDYVFDRVRAETPNQTPGKWMTDVQGKLYLAKARQRGFPVELTSPAPPSPAPPAPAPPPQASAWPVPGPVPAPVPARAGRRAPRRALVAGAVVGLLSLAGVAGVSGVLSALVLARPSATSAARTGSPSVVAGPAGSRRPTLLGDARLTAAERRLLAVIPAFYGGGTCSRMTAPDDPRNIRPEEASANLECTYPGGTMVVYSMFASDQVMREFFDARLDVRGLGSGAGTFGPTPGWQLNYCGDPDRGTGRIFGTRSTRRNVDAVRSEIGWIRDGSRTYAYAFRPTEDFTGLYAWWRAAYPSVDTHRC